MGSEAVAQPGLFPTDAFRTELLLIRHGRSAPFVPGASDISAPPLSELGRRQAGALADRVRDRPFGAIYASHLARAAETASALAAERGQPVIEDADLREVEL